MNLEFLNIVRKQLLSSGSELEIVVSGNSMEPCLMNNDRLKIVRSPQYYVGDILVFSHEALMLVHRLVKIDNQRYYCKGDNSFRIEVVDFEDILGKVILSNGIKIISCPRNVIALSEKVGEIFSENKSIETTRETIEFQNYMVALKEVYKR